ncbi:MAG TPA: hypothetical protein VFJ43_12725 [Bacteroidia bacterium]|nr:hypothetical protein [Bacteroidia bacterium]
MKNLLKYGMAMFFLLGACHDAEKNVPVSVVDSGKDSISKKAIQPDTAAKIPENHDTPIVLHRWETFWKSKHRTFDLKDFQLSGMNHFEPFYPNPIDQLPDKNDSLAYPFSPDSTWRLDVYSYQGNSDGGEPHDVVYLINVKKKQQYIVYYSGSSTYYEDGGWLDDNTFIITGHEMIYQKNQATDKNLFQAFYEIYHLDKKSAFHYDSKHYQNVDPSDYIRFRLKQQ